MPSHYANITEVLIVCQTKCYFLPGNLWADDVMLVQVFLKWPAELILGSNSSFCPWLHLYATQSPLQSSILSVQRLHNERLVINARCLLNTVAASFKTPGGILLIPAAFFLFSFCNSSDENRGDVSESKHSFCFVGWFAMGHPYKFLQGHSFRFYICSSVWEELTENVK